jgi:hypothetical protein
MFRDRVVSMEQTLEGGEKNLELLKGICREAMPEFAFREHTLDHERDLFVMVLEAPDGRTRRVCWTRMMLFDAERIPALTGDPLAASLRSRIVEFLRANVARPEIVVTFRHLEDGWVDTPEPRRDKRRRRGRGERGRREGRREGAPQPPGAQPPGSPQRVPQRVSQRPAGRPGPRPPQPPQPPRERRREPPPGAAPGPAAPEEAGKAAPGRRRRRFRRRRGRGPGGGPPPSAPSGPPQSQ